MTDYEKEIVLAYAECNMNVYETAKRTYRHRNTVTNQLKKIASKYGLDPTRFYDLVKLVKEAKGGAE